MSFSRKKEKSEPAETEEKMAEDTGGTTFLKAGVKFEGSIKAAGELRLEGCEVVAETIETGGDVVINSGAQVKGRISANQVSIGPKSVVHADISAKSKIHVQKEAVLSGNVKTPNLVTEEGSSFSGMVNKQ